MRRRENSGLALGAERIAAARGVVFGRHVVTRPAGVHEQPNPTGGVDSTVEARETLLDFRSGNAPCHGDRRLDFEMIERLAQRAL